MEELKIEIYHGQKYAKSKKPAKEHKHIAYQKTHSRISYPLVQRITSFA